MAGENLVAGMFARWPILGALVGLGMLIGGGAATVSSTREYLSMPSTPVSQTIEQAAAQVASGREPYVELTDASWACEKAFGDRTYYVPATDPAGRVLVLLGFSDPVVCGEAAKHPVRGVLAPLNSRLRATIEGLGVKLDQLGPAAPTATLVLWTYAGPGNSLTGIWIGVPFMALGVLVIWHYLRQRQRLKEQEARDAVAQATKGAAASAPANGAAGPRGAELAGPDSPIGRSGPSGPSDPVDPSVPLDVVASWRTRGPFLPPRPLRIQPEFVRRSYLVAAICTPIGLALVAALLWWQGGEVSDYLRERRLLREGTKVADAEVSGRTSGKLFIWHADLDVAYVDQAGKSHRGQQTVWYAFGDIDQKAPLEVRYDPRDPERFAVSWTVELGANRMLSVALFLAIFGLCASLPLLVAWGKLRTLRLLRRSATASDEVLLELRQVIEQIVNGSPTGQLEHRFVLVGDEKETSLAFMRHTNAPPLLFLGERHALALRCATPGFAPRATEFVLLDETLTPFDCPDALREQLMARVRSLSGSAPA